MLHDAKSLVFIDAKFSSHYLISCGSFLHTGVRMIQSIPVCNSGQVALYISSEFLMSAINWHIFFSKETL
jgi:hypothetical protein